MNTKIFFVCLMLISTLALVSCEDKVDKALDKYENIVSKYEDKQKSKTLTANDLDDMVNQLTAMAQDLETSGGAAPDQWKEKQRDRYMQLQARSSKLSMSVMMGQ